MFLAKIFNKLFGWEYIYIQFGYEHVLRKIHKAKDGTEYVKIFSKIILVEDAEKYRNVIRVI